MSSVGPKARRTTTPGVGGEESRDHRRRRVVVIDAHQICAAVVDSVDPAPPPLPSRPPRPPPLRIQAVALASSSTAAQDPCRHHGLLDIRAALVFVVEVGGEAGGSGVRRRCGERPEAAAAPVELAEVGWVGKVERGCACAVVWGCLGSKALVPQVGSLHCYTLIALQNPYRTAPVNRCQRCSLCRRLRRRLRPCCPSQSTSLYVPTARYASARHPGAVSIC
ncbi:hypothetical protein OsI_35931 [Oryza sativa Indica Group]|uniref:Uncharacterized protein n=1 Tax=Oryza sativa subsp. indica TaxID=39946 RepID=B8BK86_ORYSI|nr:hypothetical protein OsI_35931 [Oryza sativa Indica Group]